MKKYILILISFLIILTFSSCVHTPQKIEKYIKKHCDFEIIDTCYIDLCKALKVDYDTMYIFNSLIPLTGVKNILKIENYYASENDVTGYDSEMCRIILIKNHKVVYEDEYHYNDYNTELLYDDFTIVNGRGIFDGSPVNVSGYMCTDRVFRVIKIGNKHCLVNGSL
jgi:hypothetical protein